MRKWIIYIIIVLAISCIAQAILECKTVTLEKDVPCMIISAWDYTDCYATKVNIFNSSGTLVQILNFTKYGDTNRCNFTWNITNQDTYIMNVSNWDSGRIKITSEENKEMEIALSIFAVLFVIIGLFLLLRKRKND